MRNNHHLGLKEEEENGVKKEVKVENGEDHRDGMDHKAEEDGVENGEDPKTDNKEGHKEDHRVVKLNGVKGNGVHGKKEEKELLQVLQLNQPQPQPQHQQP